MCYDCEKKEKEERGTKTCGVVVAARLTGEWHHSVQRNREGGIETERMKKLEEGLGFGSA